MSEHDNGYPTPNHPIPLASIRRPAWGYVRVSTDMQADSGLSIDDGEANGHGRARELVEDPAEQQAIATMRKMRVKGSSLMAIRDAVRAKGFAISHEAVRNILARSEEVGQ